MEAQPVDLRAQIVRRQMPVDVGGHLGVPVTENPLDRVHRRTRLEEQRGGGVPQVVETDGTIPGLGPELGPVDGASARPVVRSLDRLGTALSPADVPVPFGDAGPGERPPQNALQRYVRSHESARSGAASGGRATAGTDVREDQRRRRCEVFHVPVVGLPIVNHDDNQHAADENLRLQNLWEGIETYAAMMAELKWE
jgi:hypothetical protein